MTTDIISVVSLPNIQTASIELLYVKRINYRHSHSWIETFHHDYMGSVTANRTPAPQCHLSSNNYGQELKAKWPLVSSTSEQENLRTIVGCLTSSNFDPHRQNPVLAAVLQHTHSGCFCAKRGRLSPILNLFPHNVLLTVISVELYMKNVSQINERNMSRVMSALNN